MLNNVHSSPIITQWSGDLFRGSWIPRILGPWPNSVIFETVLLGPRYSRSEVFFAGWEVIILIYTVSYFVRCFPRNTVNNLLMNIAFLVISINTSPHVIQYNSSFPNAYIGQVLGKVNGKLVGFRPEITNLVVCYSTHSLYTDTHSVPYWHPLCSTDVHHYSSTHWAILAFIMLY